MRRCDERMILSSLFRLLALSPLAPRADVYQTAFFWSNGLVNLLPPMTFNRLCPRSAIACTRQCLCPPPMFYGTPGRSWKNIPRNCSASFAQSLDAVVKGVHERRLRVELRELVPALCKTVSQVSCWRKRKLFIRCGSTPSSGQAYL